MRIFLAISAAVLTCVGAGLLSVAGPVFPSPGWPCCSTALADTVAGASVAASATAVDFGPILMALLGTAATAITVLGGALIDAGRRYLISRTGIQIDDAHRAVLDSVLQRGVAYGISLIEAQVGRATIDFHSAVVASAVKYALDRAPDAIAHLGVSPDQLATMAVARLAGMLAPAAPAAVAVDSGAVGSASGPSPVVAAQG